MAAAIFDITIDIEMTVDRTQLKGLTMEVSLHDILCCAELGNTVRLLESKLSGILKKCGYIYKLVAMTLWTLKVKTAIFFLESQSYFFF